MAEENKRKERIRRKLEEAFSPNDLQIEDQSARHKGHAGAHPEGESHFAITIKAAMFDDMTIIERHRAINEALKAEFESGLHALAINAKGVR